MKVLAINGSPRENGNTSISIQHVLDKISAEGIQTEKIDLGKKDFRGCIACFKCFETKDSKCALGKDGIDDITAAMKSADAIILGSPVYFSDVTSNMKSVIDRCGMVGRANENLYRRKLGAGVVSVRRAGAIHTFDTLNHFFLISEMIVVGSSYWNIAVGRTPGEVSGDEEGMQTMDRLGENMAWALKKIQA